MTLVSLQPKLSLPGTPAYEDCREMVMACPICHERFNIWIRMGGPYDMAKHIWKWTQPAGNSSWSAVTLEPSIQMHPHAKDKPPCPAHFSVQNGQVVLH